MPTIHQLYLKWVSLQGHTNHHHHHHHHHGHLHNHNAYHSGHYPHTSHRHTSAGSLQSGLNEINKIFKNYQPSKDMNIMISLTSYIYIFHTSWSQV